MRNLIPDLNQLGYFGIDSDKESASVAASVMFVDISGFTNMAKQLMSRGGDGAETLSLFMNTIFSPLIEAVYNHNGFILNFAGDSFTAAFKGDNGKRAVTAALEIRRFFTGHPSLSRNGKTFKISAKTGISLGNFNWIAAKGEENLRHFLFFGETVGEAAEAEHHCHANDICISEKVASLLKEECLTHIKNGARFVDTLLTPDEKSTTAETEPTAEELGIFIPQTVMRQETPGEFREVASLFISYKMSENIDEIRHMLEYLAAHVEKFGGYVSGFDFGDKGATLLAIFGAPVSYENNLERAINCVAEIRRNSPAEIRSGITQDIVYAGFVGSLKRSAYTALGDNVNLSARLMTETPYGEDWIAGKAAEKAKKAFLLESRGAHKFKGINVPIEVFGIKGHIETDEHDSFSTKLAGRKKEIAELMETRRNALSSGKLHCRAIYGEPGIGKSRLIYEVRKISENFRIFVLKADTILRQPLNMFTGLFRKLFDRNENASAEENRDTFEKIWHSFSSETIVKKEVLQAVKPYIAALAGLDGDLKPGSDSERGYGNTISAICDFFAALAETEPLMIVLDDMQAADADSLAAVRALTKRLDNCPVALYIISRLNDDGTKPPFISTLCTRFSETLLERMDRNSVSELVGNILGKKGNDRLNDFIFARTEGNPFFTEQLALFMKEKKYIRNVGGHCELSGGGTEIPSSVSSVLVSRLDRLRKDLKDLVFKASVLGNTIDLTVLEEIADEDERKNFTVLLKEGIDELIWSESAPAIYSFRHTLLRDAAYSMQLKTRLKEIHGKVAEAIEKHYENEEKFYPLLAFHYGKAENTEKEALYLKRSEA